MSTILEGYGRLQAENAALREYLARVLEVLTEEVRESVEGNQGIDSGSLEGQLEHVAS